MLGTLQNVSCACSTHQKDTDTSDSTCLNCDTVYTNISGERWRWWWQIPMKCWCPAPSLHSVTVPKTTSCVYLAFCEPQNILHTYMCSIILSQIALHSHHTEISPYFTVKGKKKLNRKYRLGSHELGCIWRQSNCNLLIDCSFSPKTNCN